MHEKYNGRFQKISIPYDGQLLGFPKERGGSRLWNSEGMGGIYDWKFEGMGGFHRWDFRSRKCRVSSLKALIAVDFCSSQTNHERMTAEAEEKHRWISHVYARKHTHVEVKSKTWVSHLP